MKYKKTSELIRNRREKLGITQSQLAAKLKYSHSQFISNFERGYSPLPLKKLNDIRKFLTIPRRELENALFEDFRKHIAKDLR